MISILFYSFYNEIELRMDITDTRMDTFYPYARGKYLFVEGAFVMLFSIAIIGVEEKIRWKRIPAYIINSM